jgi:chromosome segregation ATPase
MYYQDQTLQDTHVKVEALQRKVEVGNQNVRPPVKGCLNDVLNVCRYLQADTMEKLQTNIEELRQQHQVAEENIKTLKQEILKLESENATMRKAVNTAETGGCHVSSG